MDQSRQGNQIPQRTVPNDGVFLAADNEPNSGGAVAANDQDLPVESQQNPSANSLESL